MSLPFAKLHGLGNDFVLIDARDPSVQIGSKQARELCDRHLGIGADGVLLFTGGPDRPEMAVINADGSRPEMCGNGLRCFAKWVADHFALPGDALVVQTGAGPLLCGLQRGQDGQVASVSVAMGRPTTDPSAVPVLADAPVLDAPFEVLAGQVRLTAVGTGNPHAVVFAPLTEDQRLALGPALGAHPRFVAGVNVEFCRVLRSPDASVSLMEVHVHERGCGWTQACGTGATAAAFAAVKLGVLPADLPVQVRLPGGTLRIEIAPDGEATMTGPAVHVFEGIWRDAL